MVRHFFVMSVFNPVKPRNPQDTDGDEIRLTHGQGDVPEGQYYYDLLMMQQQYAYDDQWWNEHDSLSAMTSQLRAMGYSDAYIANFLSNNGGSSQSSPANYVTAEGVNPSDVATSALNSLSGVSNSVTNAVNADTQARVGEAQVANLKSQATKNIVDAGLAPDLAASTISKNTSSSALDYSNVDRNSTLNELTAEEIREIGKKIDLTDEQIEYYQKQNYWYDAVTIAELRESGARCAEYFSRVKLNLANVEVANSEVNLNKMLTSESYSRINLNNTTAFNVAQDTKQKKLSYQQMKYEFDYMVAHDGIKLDWDTQKKVGELVLQGKLDEAEKLCLGQYKWLFYTKSGEVLGERYHPNEVMSGVEEDKISKDLPQVIYKTLGVLGPMLYGYGAASFYNGRGRGLTPSRVSSTNPSSGVPPQPRLSDYPNEQSWWQAQKEWNSKYNSKSVYYKGK